MRTGYLHPDYAASLSELGTPRRLAYSDGWILERPIPGAGAYDAMGCYPLFCCADWSALPRDVAELGNRLVSLVVVADPLGGHTPALLQAAFDRATPYKEHFVIETGRPPEAFVRKSHRAHAMRALEQVTVETCPRPLAWLDDWVRLFDVLAVRHSIQGPRRFSRAAFEKQLAIPGLVMFRASVAGRTVGLDLWYVQGDCAQGHLAAFDATGYALHASYATKWRVIEHFSDQVRWINLGAGTSGTADGGLAAFKGGWSTGTRTSWLCGKVLEPKAYLELSRAVAPDDAYFPAYRKGEFG